jgi:hypothetical protein
MVRVPLLISHDRYVKLPLRKDHEMNQIYLYNYHEYDHIEEMTLNKFRLLFNQDHIDVKESSLFFNKEEALQRQKVNRNEKKTCL